MGDTSNTNKSRIKNLGQMISVTDSTIHGNLTLNINTSQAPQDKSPISFRIPLNPDKIIGREEDVENLRRLITSSKHKPVAITALAATGKTSLAIHCARLWSKHETGFVTDVALLDADTTDSFNKSIDELVDCLGLEVKHNTVENIKEICNFYNKNRKIVIIYDNLDNYKVFSTYRFPDDQPNVYLLATTQLTEIKSVFQCYPLGNLTPNSTKELIRSLLSQYFIRITSGNVKSLMDLFQGHTFSIVQACAYIRDTMEYDDEENINNIVEEFLVNYERYMQAELPDDFPKNYNKVLFIALKLNIEKLGNSASQHVLCLLSYMDPSRIHADEIPKFEDCLIKCNLTNSVDKGSLRNLKKFSLVSEFRDWDNSRRLNVHRLVQTVCRMLVRNNKVNLEPQYLVILMLTLEEALFEDIHYSYLLEHVQFRSLEEACKLYIQHPQNIQTVQEYSYISTMEDDLKTWTILHVDSLKEDHIGVLMTKFPELRTKIDYQTNTGLSALHIAALSGNRENVCHLRDNGCDMNLQDQLGNTAGHLAALFFDWANETLNDIYRCNRFCKNIINHIGHTVVECIGQKVSYTFKHKLSSGEVLQVQRTRRGCAYSVKSLSKEILQEGFVYWECTINCKKLVQVLIDELQTRVCWSDSEAKATHHVISLLCNVWDRPHVERYITTENITVSTVSDSLTEDKLNNELIVFTAESRNTRFHCYYKLVSVVINRVNEVYPDAFTLLAYISYSSEWRVTENHLIRLLKGNRAKTEECLQVLGDYDLIWKHNDIVYGVHIVCAMMHVYVSERKLTRNIVSVLLDNSRCTDEEIDLYLKTTKF